jgi:hypothetical protein
MKIKFKKKRVIFNLILSIFYLVIGLEGIINQRNIRWTKYVFLIIGTIFLIKFLFEISNQYLTIKNGILKKNKFFARNIKINLNDIILINKLDEGYKLYTDVRVIVIYTELIDDDSNDVLTRILSKLDLPPYKTPFHVTDNQKLTTETI